MPQHPKSIKYPASKGLNNVSRPEDTDPSYLIQALNIDIDKTGSIRKRRGYTLVDAANYSSIWASTTGLGCYGVRNGDLVQIYPDYSYRTLVSGVGNIAVSFEEIDSIIYFSSSNTNGTIIDEIPYHWGIPKNQLAPSLTAVGGTLDAGTYQVSFTYVDSRGGESGTIHASIITVPSGSGISLYIPPVSDGSLVSARVYCSTTDGDTLFYEGTSTLNTTHFISSSTNLINPLRTFNLDKPPLGSIIRHYKGRMYIADSNILWYSEPFQYNYFKLDSNYFEFPKKIEEVMVVDDGIWIGSDKIYYLAGSDPDKFRLDIKESVSVVPGTSTRISASYARMDGVPGDDRWLVTTDLGIFMLFNQGVSSNLTSATIDVPDATSGTSLFLQEGGINRYLSILKTIPDPNKVAMGDMVESQVIRNGVVIP